MFSELLRPYFRYSRLRAETTENFRITPEIVRVLRNLPYLEQWKQARANNWFHVALEDHSLFLFKIGEGASYHFYDRPLDAVPLSEYIEGNGGTYSVRTVEQFKEEYGEYLLTARAREHVTPIRYDLDFGAYRTGVHPAAHIHVGLDNHIRIGLHRELTPLSFFLFVLRQMYPRNWEFLMGSNLGQNLDRRIRTDLREIEVAYLKDQDRVELALL